MGFSAEIIHDISSLHADCLTKWVRQFRVNIAINGHFECSVFRVQGGAGAMKGGAFLNTRIT